MVLVALSVATGTPLPLTAAQILWLNLVTNGIQDVALAFEPGQGDELRRPPRPPREPIFDRIMAARVAVSAVTMGVAAYVVFRLWLGDAAGQEATRSTAAVAAARNATLLAMVLLENVHLGNCRSETRSAFSSPPWRSPFLLVRNASSPHAAGPRGQSAAGRRMAPPRGNRGHDPAGRRAAQVVVPPHDTGGAVHAPGARVS
jgi:magnesium-transporting ATPase (P-type)